MGGIVSENHTPDHGNPDERDPELHDPQRRDRGDDALLEAVLSGELSPDSAEVLERIDESPEFRKEIEGLMTIQQELDAAARLRRRVLERADNVEIETEDAHASLIRKQLGGGTPPAEAQAEPTASPATITRLSRPMLAAAALILVGVGAWLGGFFDGPQRIPMNEGQIELIAPLGTVADVDRFEWKFTEGLVPGGFYRVTVFTDAGRFVSDDLYEPFWEPPADLSAGWGSFAYTVEAMKPDDTTDESSGDPVSVTVKRP